MQNLKNLKMLNLSGTGVEAVWTLTKPNPLTSLTNLDLSNNKNFSNAMPLGALKNLKTLNLSRTNVTQEQVESLKIMLPGCNIIR